MERFCRICMAMEKNKAFKSLFYDEPNFAEILFYVSEVVVFEVLGEPPALICRQCEIDLMTAARIKKLSLETDSFLKTMSSTVDLQLLTSIMNGEEEIKIKVEEDADDIIGAFKGFEVDSSLIKLELIGDVIEETPPSKKVSRKTINSGAKRRKKATDSLKDKSSEIEEKSKVRTKEGTVKRKRQKTLRQCPVEGCNYKCWNSWDLNKHSFVHTDERPVSCEICDFKAKSIYNLKSHMYSHVQTRNFSCEKCGMSFKLDYTLRNHIKTVHADPNLRHICDLCGRDFKCRTSIKNHIVRVHDKRYERVCHLCGKTLSCPEKLKQHMYSFHQKGEKKFECPICQQKFMRKHKMQVHVDSHGERAWACDFCDKTFARRFILAKHCEVTHKVKMEFEPKRHICIICGQTYNQEALLKDHMITVHNLTDS